MEIKAVLSALIEREGKEILLPENRIRLTELLTAQQAYAPEMQAFLLCLSCTDPAAMAEMREMTLTEYQNLLRSCILHTKLQYDVCVEDLSLLLSLMQITVSNVSAEAKSLLPEPELPLMRKYCSYEDVQRSLAEAKAQNDPNAAATINAELMRADVTEAFYRYGIIKVSQEKAADRRTGEQSLMTAATRGHVPAALFLGDYYMTAGEFAKAHRYYCGFGAPMLNAQQRDHVYVLELMKRTNLRVIVLEFLFALLGIAGALILAFRLPVSTGGFIGACIGAAVMAGCAVYAVCKFFKEPLFHSQPLYIAELTGFFAALFSLIIGTDVII